MGRFPSTGRWLHNLKLVDFAPGTQLSPEGNTEFVAPADAKAIPATAQVRQGMLEVVQQRSGHKCAVALIDLQRSAEMMQRALTIFNTDFNQTAVQELPRV